MQENMEHFSRSDEIQVIPWPIQPCNKTFKKTQKNNFKWSYLKNYDQFRVKTQI